MKTSIVYQNIISSIQIIYAYSYLLSYPKLLTLYQQNFTLYLSPFSHWQTKKYFIFLQTTISFYFWALLRSLFIIFICFICFIFISFIFFGSGLSLFIFIWYLPTIPKNIQNCSRGVNSFVWAND